MTGRPKTGDELFSIVKDDLGWMKITYGVETILVVTDNGPDGKKMRRLVKEEKLSNLFALECWAHQTGLLTGNYIAIKVPFMGAVAQANEVVKWWNNHGKALDLLVQQQILVNDGKVLALTSPNVTRWTSHFTSMGRLHTLEPVVLGCTSGHRDKLLVAGGTKRDVREKAESVIEICLSSAFWRDLAMCVSASLC
jgi:hypothetical protein